MNKGNKYDVFISYRREGGDKYARTIQLELEKKYNVFLDFDELKDGVFDQRIMDAIKEASVFLLVLSHGALDRCINEDDWVRKEILYAAMCQSHIVPVTIIDDNFEGVPANLPEDLKKLVGAHQFSELQMRTLFKSSMEELIRNRIEPYIKANGNSGAEIHLEAEMDCELYCFNKHLATLHPNQDNIIRLQPGTYKFTFKSTLYPGLQVTQKYSLSPGVFSDYIEVDLHPKNLKLPPVIQQIIENMVVVEGGVFMMGATPEQGEDAEIDERPCHSVKVETFSIGKFAVTQEEWETIMGINPSGFQGLRLPVEQVSWYDCESFITKLNEITGMSFRLPTEEEWEFAARGGILSKGYKFAGSNNIEEVAWYYDNCDGITHEVGKKKPNELGLYDMSGNVWEWCQDTVKSSDIIQDKPSEKESLFSRRNRGGGWISISKSCRVSNRNGSSPDVHYDDLGFRLAL